MDLSYMIYINASPEKVWEALTSKEGVAAIYFGSELRTSFEPGDDYAYVGPGAEGTETVHVYGKILECEPGRLLRMTEHAGPAYNPNHADFETRVTYTIESFEDSTRLTLVNDNWPPNHPSYVNTQAAWPMVISNIKSFAETGLTMKFGF